MDYVYKTSGTCSKEIRFSIENGFWAKCGLFLQRKGSLFLFCNLLIINKLFACVKNMWENTLQVLSPKPIELYLCTSKLKLRKRWSCRAIFDMLRQTTHTDGRRDSREKPHKGSDPLWEITLKHWSVALRKRRKIKFSLWQKQRT